MEKRCRACGEPFDLDTGFSKNPTHKDGRSSFCKACDAAAARERYHTDRMRRREQQAGYYRENHDAWKAHMLAYYHANRDRINAARREKRRRERDGPGEAFDRTPPGTRIAGILEKNEARIERMDREGVSEVVEYALGGTWAVRYTRAECVKLVRIMKDERRLGIERMRERKAA